MGDRTRLQVAVVNAERKTKWRDLLLVWKTDVVAIGERRAFQTMDTSHRLPRAVLASGRVNVQNHGLFLGDLVYVWRKIHATKQTQSQHS